MVRLYYGGRPTKTGPVDAARLAKPDWLAGSPQYYVVRDTTSGDSTTSTSFMAWDIPVATPAVMTMAKHYSNVVDLAKNEGVLILEYGTTEIQYDHVRMGRTGAPILAGQLPAMKSNTKKVTLTLTYLEFPGSPSDWNKFTTEYVRIYKSPATPSTIVTAEEAKAMTAAKMKAARGSGSGSAKAAAKSGAASGQTGGAVGKKSKSQGKADHLLS